MLQRQDAVPLEAPGSQTPRNVSLFQAKSCSAKKDSKFTFSNSFLITHAILDCIYRPRNRMLFLSNKLFGHPPVSSLVTALLSVREVRGSNPGSVKSNTGSPKARHRCDVSSQLCCPGLCRGDGEDFVLNSSGNNPAAFEN